MYRILALGLIAVVTTGAALAQQGNPGQHFLDQWDADGDGRVTAEEVVAKRSDVFGMFDQNADQVLTAEDWALIEEHVAMELGQGGAGQGLNRAAPGQAMREAMTPAFNDADGDGQVTLAEFDAASAKLFPLMDVDSDGAVTAADFAR